MPTKKKSESRSKPTFIMIHHSAVSYDDNPDQFEANNRYHKNKWNFISSLGFYLGYNYEIAKSGKLRQARQNGEVTAACSQSRMNNGKCIHICLDGNFDKEKPSDTQIFVLRDLLRDLREKHNIDKNNIVSHNMYAKKSCPGKNIKIEFIREISESPKQ